VTGERTGARVELAHGAGGRAMRSLIESVFLAEVTDPEALAMGDGAAIPFGDRWLVVTTDAHVVVPIFFPGGDIGRLSSRVVNDLAMMGACDVIALTSSVVVEEGFSIESLRRIHASMQAACREAGTRIVTGDTKVMRKGEIDGVVLSTSGSASPIAWCATPASSAATRSWSPAPSAITGSPSSARATASASKATSAPTSPR